MLNLKELFEAAGLKNSAELRRNRDRAIGNMVQGNRTHKGTFTSAAADIAAVEAHTSALRSTR